jgi:hypothetical protein
VRFRTLRIIRTWHYGRVLRRVDATPVLHEAHFDSLQTTSLIFDASKQRQLSVDIAKPLLQDMDKTDELDNHNCAHKMNHESDDDVDILFPSPAPQFVTVTRK